MGGSMLNNIQESRLSKKHNVKVHAFPGADINRMYPEIHSSLIMEAKNVILHIGTNDAP